VIDDMDANTPPARSETIVGSPYVTLGLWVDGTLRATALKAMAALLPTFPDGRSGAPKADGCCERIGRKTGSQIRGDRVDLEGVEAALRQHPWCATSRPWRAA